MQSKRLLGLSKNKTFILVKYKEEIIQRKNKHKELYLLKESDKKDTSINTSIEMSEKAAAPWVYFYQDTIDHIRQVRDLSIEINQLTAKRIKITFGDTQVIEKQINEKNAKATQKLMTCEKNVQNIAKLGETIEESNNERKIRINVQKALAAQISELTQTMRNQQKRMVNIIRQSNQDGGGGNFLKISSPKQSEIANDTQLSAAELEMYEESTQERDEDISKLVEMVNDLATVFKSLNQLVIDQGTILDRIDYNIEQTADNVKKANVKLREADKYQNSPLARRCIIILLVLIAIFSIILTFKYSKS